MWYNWGMTIYIIFGLVFFIISSGLILLIGRKIFKISELKFLNIFVSLLISFSATGLVLYFSQILAVFGAIGILCAVILPAAVLMVCFHFCIKKTVPMLNFTYTFVFIFSSLLLFSLLFFVVIVPLINSQF